VLSSPAWIVHNSDLGVINVSVDSPALEIDINASAYR
jgi:hypothetical protein